VEGGYAVDDAPKLQEAVMVYRSRSRATRLAALLLSTPAIGCAMEAVTDRSSDVAGAKADGLSGGCARPAMYIMGTPRNFGVAPGGPLAMTCVDGIWQVEELFAGTGNVFQAGGFKFHDTGDWSSGTNWGDSPPFDGQAEMFGDGNDIVIAEAGTYRSASSTSRS
jgi:hypothetical protein